MKKNASIFNLLLTAAIFLLLSGCRKSLTEDQTNPLLSTGNRGSTLTKLDVTPDVYVAGSLGGQAAYWKNGVSVVLPGGSMATAIAVVGTDVYVCGWGFSSTFTLVAQYWKNGVLTTLSDGTEEVIALGIAVLGTDVYVAGSVGEFGQTGVYWKNGVATALGAGQPNGIVVSPTGDIYIPNGQTGNNPTYWLNGSLVNLPGNATSHVNAMAVQGSNVYAVGVDDHGNSQKALYWQNGTAGFLVNTINSNAMAVAVNASGQALISGTTGQNLNDLQIGYWNTLGDLSALSSGEFVSISTGVTVDGTTGDVYVCGSEFNTPSTGPAIAKYWKIVQGSPQLVTLSNGSTDATAVAITLGQ